MPRHRYIIPGLLLAVTACAPRSTPGNAEAQGPLLDSLRLEILDLVGEPRCDNVQQCRAIAFGAKPCGGPWSYLVYSTTVTDSATLAAVVADYNVEEERLNRSLGRVSDCRMVTRPDLACEASRCVAR